MIEEWKDIYGYEGIYQISSLGRVKSLKRKCGFLISKDRILKPYKKKNGYLQIDLNKNNIKSKKHIHRLVSEAFIPNPNHLKTVNHKDKNRTNNCVDNLEWMSYSENNLHGQCQIKSGISRRIPIYQCDLNGNIIKEWSCAKIAAEELGYKSYSPICACCRNRIKTYKGYIWKYV